MSSLSKQQLIHVAKKIQPDSIPLSDCHMHTAWTDGSHSAAEMHAAALAHGLEHIVFSEHARATSGDWFPEFAEEVRALPQDQCQTHVGVECKISNFEGDIDTASSITDYCDIVMASVHRFPTPEGGVYEFSEIKPDQALDVEFKLSLAAVANPQIDVLGHCFGMSLKRFQISPPEEMIRLLFKTAAQNNTAIDINAAYHKSPWTYIKWCGEEGAKILLGSDAHRVEDVGLIQRLLHNAVDNKD